MAITRALGLGIAILVLKAFAPAIMTQIENTAVAFLTGAATSAQVAASLASRAEHIQLPDTSQPIKLPRLPER